MDVAISIDVRDLERKANELGLLLGVEPADIVRKHFGSVVKTIIRYTYPASQKQGEQRVEKDIRKIFVSPPDLFPRGSNLPTLDAALKASQYDKAVAIINKMARFRNLTVADAPSAGVHAQYKNNRGRVRQKQAPVVLVKNPEALKSYVKEVQAHVGKAKASWLAAAQKFGASGIVAYATRHGSAEGSATDAIRDGTGYVEGVSRNAAVESIEQRSHNVSRALENSEKALTIRLEKTLEKLSKKF